MTITNERAEALAKYLSENVDKAETLHRMTAEEAVLKINEDGFDFTADELSSFAEEMEKVAALQNEELSENDLDNVAGGVMVAQMVNFYLRLLKLGVRLASWMEAEVRRRCNYWK